MLRRFVLCAAVLVMGGLVAACAAPESDSRPASAAPGTDSSSSKPPSISAERPPGQSAPRLRGQTLYVPCYSHIYFQDERRTLDLASTLTIRNTSTSDTITVTQVDYYDSDGVLVRRYLSEDRTLLPLASTYFVVRVDDLRGGVGANFLVTWASPEPVDPPYVEAVHITTEATLGISFTSDARVLTQVE